MSKSPLVYIAGPYSTPDPVQNTHIATEFGLSLYENYKCGVIIPHLTLLAHAMFPRPEKFWYDFDFKQLDHCDALIRLAGLSKGADEEENRALHTLKIPVFHWDKNEEAMAFVEWIDQWTDSGT